MRLTTSTGQNCHLQKEECPCQLAFSEELRRSALSLSFPSLRRVPPRQGTSIAALLDMYQPVTYLDPVEQFGPASVQSFVADADLEQFDAGSWVLVDPDPEPGELPGPGTGTWRLNQDSCTPHVRARRARVLRGCRQRGSRSQRRLRTRRTGSPARSCSSTGSSTTTTSTRTPIPPSDFIWQAHEGDWEAVNVVLSEDEQPQFVGYSQHCLGQRRAWSSTPLLGTHPVVYVAAGSHANYFSAGIHPINIQCIPPPAIAFLQAAHLPLPADHVFRRRRSGRAA